MARRCTFLDITGKATPGGARITQRDTGAARQINALIRALDHLKNQITEVGAQEAAERIGQTVLDNTIPFVPVDTTALERSGIYLTERTANGWRAVVSFGGETPITGKNSPEGVVHYAAFVHENVGHDYSKPQKPLAQAKFLEAGMALSQEEVSEIVTRTNAKLI